MPRPIYNQKITRSTDWGGDASTNNAPVSGARVQEYIKDEIITLEEKHGELSGAHDTLTSRVDTLETAQASHTSQITGIQQVISAQGEAIGALQNTQAAHAQDIAQIQASDAARGEAITGLQIDLGQMQQNIQALDDAKADKSAFIVLSDTQYDALSTKDDDIFYYIYEE